jgi:hypothetical protein
MNPRTTGLLLLAALGLGAFVWLYEIEGESGRLETEERTKRLFSGIEPEDVDWIALTTTDDVAARFARTDGAWRMLEPVGHPADAAVGRMAEALATVTWEAALDSPGSDTEYALDESSARVVRFGAGDAEHTLLLGRDTPVGSNLYAKTGDGDAVYTVASYRKNAFERALVDLRDKQILAFDPSAIREVEARWPDGRVVVARATTASEEDAATQVGDDADADVAAAQPWRGKMPVEAPGDDDAIDGLLSTLTFLRADAFIDAPTEAETALLDPPAFSVTLRGTGEPLSLAVGRTGADERRPVSTGGGAPQFWIGADRLEDFPRRSSAYRDRTLASIDTTQAQQLDFFFHSAAGEAVALHASRDADGVWRSEPEPFAEGQLARIVAELVNLEADDVLAESMGEDELRGVGLSPPNTIVTVLGATPEAGEDALAPQAPILVDLHLGDVTAAGVVARRAGDETIYRLGIDVAERLPVSYEAFVNRFRAAPASAPEDEPLPETDPGAEWIDPGEESP